MNHQRPDLGIPVLTEILVTSPNLSAGRSQSTTVPSLAAPDLFADALGRTGDTSFLEQAIAAQVLQNLQAQIDPLVEKHVNAALEAHSQPELDAAAPRPRAAIQVSLPAALETLIRQSVANAMQKFLISKNKI